MARRTTTLAAAGGDVSNPSSMLNINDNSNGSINTNASYGAEWAFQLEPVRMLARTGIKVLHNSKGKATTRIPSSAGLGPAFHPGGKLCLCSNELVDWLHS